MILALLPLGIGALFFSSIAFLGLGWPEQASRFWLRLGGVEGPDKTPQQRLEKLTRMCTGMALLLSASCSLLLGALLALESLQ